MNNFTFDENDEAISVYLKNISSTIPIFKIDKSDIRLEKYQNVSELMSVINKIFSDIDTSILTKDDFNQKMSGEGPNSKTITALHKRFINLRNALVYGKTKSVNINKIQQERLSEMIRRIIKEESNSNAYNKKDVDAILDNALSGLYTALNELEDVSRNYFKSTGNAGMTSAFYKKVKLSELKNIIEILEEMSK